MEQTRPAKVSIVCRNKIRFIFLSARLIESVFFNTLKTMAVVSRHIVFLHLIGCAHVCGLGDFLRDMCKSSITVEVGLRHYFKISKTEMTAGVQENISKDTRG